MTKRPDELIPTHIVYTTTPPQTPLWERLEATGAVKRLREVADLTIYFVHAPHLSLRELNEPGDGAPRSLWAYPNRRYRSVATWRSCSAPIKAASSAQPVVEVPEVCGERLTGAGVVIGFVDSGICPDHETLKGALAPLPYYDTIDKTKDFNYWDRSGHGTAVASIALGRETASHRGVAPGATCVVAGAFYSDNTLSSQFVVDAVSWLLELALQGDIGEDSSVGRLRVINLSLAMNEEEALELLYPRLEEAGVLVVVAAGNCAVVTPPASCGTAVAVGATDSKEEVYALSASANPERLPGAFIMAPGVSVTGASDATTCSYLAWTGTSFAAPAVSGAAALLLQAAPHLTPVQLREILATSAKDLAPEGYDMRSGSGLIDVAAAVALARKVPTPAPT